MNYHVANAMNLKYFAILELEPWHKEEKLSI